MATRGVVDQSFRIAYQPFLSSTRTRQLTSTLSSSLPHTFLPITNTSLSLPAKAQIILVSRGGKPFAPVHQRLSIDSTLYKRFREQDWWESSEKYEEYRSQWDQAQEELPKLLTSLRKYFSDSVIAKRAFHKPLRILTYTGEIKDPEAVQKTIESYRSLLKARKFLHKILEETQALTKLSARKAFGLPHLRAREYLIEDHRDRLDLFRLELERRYMGMAMVRFPSVAEPKPWILLPEDPVAAWGVDFPYKVGELIRLAQLRFLATDKEKDEALEEEAKTVIGDNATGIIQNVKSRGDKVVFEEILKEVMSRLREEKERLYVDDNTALVLPGNLGDLGPEFRAPVTREDRAINQFSEEELVKLCAWRVED
jgi:hypothetical protein